MKQERLRQQQETIPRGTERIDHHGADLPSGRLRTPPQQFISWTVFAFPAPATCGTEFELLRQGERAIVLDMARVSSIDAGGIGELVRAYNMTLAMQGELRIVHATRRVRELLQRTGLFDRLTS